jgi:hypothetical protein
VTKSTKEPSPRQTRVGILGHSSFENSETVHSYYNPRFLVLVPQKRPAATYIDRAAQEESTLASSTLVVSSSCLAFCRHYTIVPPIILPHDELTCCTAEDGYEKWSLCDPKTPESNILSYTNAPCIASQDEYMQELTTMELLGAMQITP